MAATPTNKEPLQDFQKLGDYVHLYKPVATTPASASDPGLVIICSWAFAQVRHISKYLGGYRERFPAIQILLLQTDTANLFWRPEAWQVPLFEPAVLAITKYITSGPKSQILLHIFSNGGSYTAFQLAQVYRHSSGKAQSHELPINAIILDSCPGLPNHRLGVRAISMGLPKTTLAHFIGVPMIHLSLSLFRLLHELGISESASARAYRELNRLGGPFLSQDIPRTYIYSKTDAVMLAEHIIRHAQEARAELKGAPDGLIRVEEFVGSQHVNHVSFDPERYWAIVRETWETALELRQGERTA